MIVALTARLIAIPEHGWPRLAAALEAGDPLPPPHLHAGAVVALGSLGPLLGGALDRHDDVSAFARMGIALICGALALGAAMLVATRACPKPDLSSRYGATVVMPLAASALILLILPVWALTPLWTLAGAGLTFLSARAGALSLFGSQGRERDGLALLVSGAAGVPAMIGAFAQVAVTGS